MQDNMFPELRHIAGHLGSPRAIWQGVVSYCHERWATAMQRLDDLAIGAHESLGLYVDREWELYVEGATYSELSKISAVGQLLQGLPPELGRHLHQWTKPGCATFDRVRAAPAGVSLQVHEGDSRHTDVGKESPPELAGTL